GYAGFRHIHRIQNTVQFFLVQKLFFQDKAAHGFASLHRLFGNVRSFLVSHIRTDSGDDSHTVFHQIAAALFIGGDAGDAVVHKSADSVGQRVDGLEHAVEDNGLEGVQFQLSGLGGHRDGNVVADD